MQLGVSATARYCFGLVSSHVPFSPAGGEIKLFGALADGRFHLLSIIYYLFSLIYLLVLSYLFAWSEGTSFFCIISAARRKASAIFSAAWMPTELVSS